MRVGRRFWSVFAAGAIAFVPASAAFARGVDPVGPGAPLPNYDVRDSAAAGAGAMTSSSARSAGPPANRASMVARAQLADSLGDQAVVQADPVNGTLRTIQKLDGALTDAGGGSAQDRAWGYVRAHATAIGLDDADLATFAPQEALRGSGGLVVQQFAQSVDGIPTLDNVLKVGVDGDGRVLNVTGSPNPDLDGVTTTPTISASDALRAAYANTAVRHAVPAVKSGPTGARQTTDFVGDDRAALVLFGDVGVTRLAWRVLVHAREAVYDVVVDAANGDVLRRANLTDAASNQATVFPAWPGRGTAPVDLTPYLDEAQVDKYGLAGPNVWAWADLTDSNYPFTDPGPDTDPRPDQIIHRDDTTGFDFPLTRVTDTDNTDGHCDVADTWCTWDGTGVPGPPPNTTWGPNREVAVTNMFWLVNVFHDHLATDAGIDFHGFEGDDDRIWANGLDGASTGPDLAHIDNANMATYPEGYGAVMQMYLATTIGGYQQRDVDYDLDPLTIWHEYTHGLSNRLIVDATGFGALNAQQSGSMGEGWSDWYALDLAVNPPADYPTSPVGSPIIDDNTGVAGDVNLGAYTDPVPGMTRTESIDCPIGASASPWCAGTSGVGHTGGYTYADFGKIIGRPEVHADGEIWAQTLWDLRDAVGSSVARDLVTNGMRLTTPNPSFLDARNGILAAATGNSALQTQIWTVFAHRGMGFFAGAASGGDVAPVADDSMPPADGGPTGTVAGTVTDMDSSQPVQGATVAFGGHEAAVGQTSPFVDTTDAAGGYSMTIPPGSYSKLTFSSPGYDSVTLASPVTVTSGGRTIQNQTIRRDWASLSGGSAITESDPLGSCGPQLTIDGDRSTGWSASRGASSTRTLVFTLPQAIDIAQIGIDPTEVCGDDAAAAAGRVRVSTSSGGDYTVALDTTFTSADRNALKLNSPTAGASGVTKVKLELLSPQSTGGSGGDWIDIRELEIYGAPASSGGGGGGTSTTPVTPPEPTPTPIPTTPPDRTPSTPPSTEPSIAPPPRVGRHGAVTVKADCARRCTITATLSGDRRVRKLLGAHRARVARSVLRAAAGEHRVKVSLTRKQRQKLRRAGRHHVTLRLVVRVRQTNGDTASRTRRVTIRV